MTYVEIKATWDAQADESNQWDELGYDEKIERAFGLALKYHPEPVAWYVTGCSTLLDEHDAKVDVKRCGECESGSTLYKSSDLM